MEYVSANEVGDKVYSYFSWLFFKSNSQNSTEWECYVKICNAKDHIGADFGS